MPSTADHKQISARGPATAPGEDPAIFSWESTAHVASHSSLHESNLPALSAPAGATLATPKLKPVDLARNQIAIDRLRLMAELLQSDKMGDLHDRLARAEGISGWVFDFDDDTVGPLTLFSAIGTLAASFFIGCNNDSFLVGLGAFGAIGGTIIGAAIGSWFLYRAYKRAEYSDNILQQAGEDVAKAYAIWKEIHDAAAKEGKEREYTSAETERLFSPMLAEKVDQLLSEANQLEQNPKTVALPTGNADL